MVKCPNCRLEIEEEKWLLHERFCSQNVVYCEECKEAIVKEEYEEHCKSHNNPNKIEKEESQEEKDSKSLERVMSSKIACEFCGFLLGFNEIEEHEYNCGSRTTNCRICKEVVVLKNLKDHLSTVHKNNMDEYEKMDSADSRLVNKVQPNENVDQPKQNFKGNMTEDEIQRMTSDEQIQYALAISQQENNENNKNSKEISNSQELSKKESSDEIEYDADMYNIKDLEED